MVDMTPFASGYATPGQIAPAYSYGEELRKGGMRDAPITSPWQGVRMMADALAGRYQLGKTGQQEQASRGAVSAAMPQNPYTQPPASITPQAPPAAIPQSPVMPPVARPPQQNSGVPFQNNPFAFNPMQPNPMMAALTTPPPNWME